MAERPDLFAGVDQVADRELALRTVDADRDSAYRSRMLAEILVAEGSLDDTQLVTSIVPELADSAFGNATIRQVMDMTTGLAYSENYSDPNADIWIYSRAASPLPKPPGYDGPDGYFEYLQTV